MTPSEANVKATLSTLFLRSLAALCVAASLNAGVTISTVDETACSGPVSGTLTYALASVTGSVASSGIDIGADGGMFITVTGAARTLEVSYSGDGSTYIPSFNVLGPGNFCIPKMGRYVRFRSAAGNGSNTMTVYYQTTSGRNTGGFLPLGMTTYSVSNSTATSINITSSAQSNTNCYVCFASNGGAASGFKVQFNTSATAPVSLTDTSAGHYVAASATSQCWPLAPGSHAHIAGVGGTSSVQVDIFKVQ